MKIYYIINGRLPTEKANGYQVSQMCQAFIENGADVTLLRPKRNLSEAHKKYINDLKSFYSLRKQIRIDTVWSFDFQHFFHEISHLFDRFQVITNLLHTMSFVIGLSLFFLFQREKGLIYLRDVNILSWLSIFLLPSWKNNIVLELHYLPKEWLKRQRYIRILNKSFVVIAITNKMKEDLVSLGFPADKVWVEHDGVDLGSFSGDLSLEDCRRDFNLPIGRPVVGYVGNFHTNGLEKGLDDIIRASQKVLESEPETLFFFVGGPMDRVPKYHKLIRELGLPPESFIFHDRVATERVARAMAACDILTIPLPWNPYFAYYMSPMKLFEYMASGRCIVATNIESLSEILKHRQNALLAQHSNVNDFGTKLIEAIRSPQLRQSMADAARQDVRYYSWNLRAQRIIQFYQDSHRNNFHGAV